MNKESFIDVVEKEGRVIEIDARSRSLLSFLKERGCGDAYLGITRDNSLLKEKDHFFTLTSLKQVQENNAHTLVLSGKSSLYLWMFETYQHSRYVLVPRAHMMNPLVWIGVFRHVKRKNLAKRGTLVIGTENYAVFEVAQQHIPLRKMYIPPRIGIERFFSQASQRGLSYVILRWFDQLPDLLPGEDIDLLVADDDIEELRSLTKNLPGAIPCDVFSVSGLPGTSFRGMAYYPVPCAEGLLKRAVLYESLYKVPCEKDYFLSLSYHALYHKGLESGIPTSSSHMKPASPPDHEYAQILKEIAKRLSLSVEITMETLDEFLEKEGWRPQSDTLRRISKENVWVRETFFKEKQNEELFPGLGVFVVRKKAIDEGHLTFIRDMIISSGFYILYEKKLSSREIEEGLRFVRGGNWGRGPFPVSGGPPEYIFVCHDVLRKAPSSSYLNMFPHLSNERLLIKHDIRKALNKNKIDKEKYNPLHSSDNGEEALEYIAFFAPEYEKKVSRDVDALEKSFETPFPVVKDLTENGKRAKVEVVRYNGGDAVCKTFRPGKEHLLKKEVFVMETFSKERSEIPNLLAKGGQYVLYPYYKNTLKRGKDSYLPLSVAKQAIELLHFFYTKGYFLLDAHHNNLLLDPQKGLKLVDFELIQQYEKKPDLFSQSYDVVGVPDTIRHTLVADIGVREKRTYDNSWKRRTGLSFDSLIKDSTWKQYILRVSNKISTFPRVALYSLRIYFWYPLFPFYKSSALFIDRMVRRCIIFVAR